MPAPLKQTLSQHSHNHRFSIAPMMDWSDRHCRYFWRLLTKNTLLYTEMVTTGALVFGDKERFLNYNQEEHPVALQVGGCDPAHLAQSAELAQRWDYDEINLNCGCPSDRVQAGKIGAVLMAEPELVAQCVEAMINSCDIPVTVKHRIGIDDMEDYSGMANFVSTVAEAGCQTFIVHARKAWLKGLSPKENREVPPLKYELVYQLKQDFPHLNIIINGGITTIEQSKELLNHVDGVMIGREAYNNPYFLANIDNELYSESNTTPSRMDIALEYMKYCENQLQNGARLHHMTRHMLGLFQGQPRARLFRKYLTENAYQPDVGIDVLKRALDVLTP